MTDLQGVIALVKYVANRRLHLASRHESLPPLERNLARAYPALAFHNHYPARLAVLKQTSGQLSWPLDDPHKGQAWSLPEICSKTASRAG
jgi:hypothetical protein